MVDQIAQVALETLRDLLIEEVRFLYGVSDEVEDIQRELKTIHCFLKDADARPDRYNSQTVRNLVGDLKNLASRAEDVLENYAINVTSKRRGRSKNLKQKLKRYACILGEWLSVHRTGKEIESIKSRMADLTKKLESMPSSSADHAQQQQQQELLLRQTYAHEVEEHFVGMEKDIEHLVSLINDDESRSNRVISICGMGGLGKTTLARKIYNHKEVQSRFECRAWVCISQQFQPKNVLQEILKQILPGQNDMEQNELVRKLYDVQKQKKCLVVIDDIWEKDHWDILRKAFPIAEVDCKVLITTRNENVASEENVYRLDYLTEDQGWELLLKIAMSNFHTQDIIPEAKQLEVIGREIVQKCGRLPLAISVVGGSLRGKQTSSDWEKVSNNIDTYLKYGEGANEKDKRVRQVLDLSYNVLPYYLKPCFLYLGTFKEDEEIDTERLYLLWMAEGLISSEEKGSNETLRDVAERYLSELRLKCMVQVRYHNLELFSKPFSSTYNKFVSCQLHDLMRDLCLSKGQDEDFIKVMELSEGKQYADPCIGSIRRLSIHLEHVPLDNLVEREESKSLRSLLLRSKHSFMYMNSKHILFTNMKEMKFLRILILEYCRFEDRKLPSEVGKLVLLKYLSLFKSDVRELPASICYLPYLHTLDLRVLHHHIRLPNLIHKMKRLRHLFLTTWSVKEDELLILEGLKELETLVSYFLDLIRIADLCKLTNLRLLEGTFQRNENVSLIVNHMYQLREAYFNFWNCDFSQGEEGSTILNKMLMCHSSIRLSIRGRIGCNLPCFEIGMCRNLVELILEDTEIEGVDVMEVVGKFPMLKSFQMSREVVAKTNILICHAFDFPKLMFLGLGRMTNIEKWEVEQGAMPNISHICIYDCRNLGMIPDGFKFLSTLQRLECCDMPKEFNDRLQVVNGEAGPDYHKISHIPLVQCHDL